MKELVFVDDSGDPGFKTESSSNFVLAAIYFAKPREAELAAQEISEYRKSLGWNENYEFKFAKVRKDVIVELLQLMTKYEFQIYAVHLEKTSFLRSAPIIDKEKMYNWVMKELLCRVPLTDAKIEIDGRSGKQYMQRATSYLRRQINVNNDKKLKIRFEDSTKDNLIQLADLVAGAINRYISSEKTDANVYFGVIKDKIASLEQLN